MPNPIQYIYIYKLIYPASYIPGAGSALIDAADPGSAAYEDILGQARGPSPDIGAVETNPEDLIFVDDFE